MNATRINPNRLSTPSEINEALDAISAELAKLRDIQERVIARKDEIMAKVAVDGIPGLADAEDPAAFLAQLIADATAFRAMGTVPEASVPETADAVDAEDDADDDGEDMF